MLLERTDNTLDSSIKDGEDTIKILLTTDNHVGYKENDPIRGDDSWKTFNEIVVLAKEHDVDMILHGGDLFHVNKPSKKSMFHVLESLRLHCLGDRPCELELLSDPLSITGGDSLPVNYEDPNINVSIPIFAINGNHDDLTGPSLLLPLDLLSVSGFVNNFGKVTDTDQITVAPVLLQKGSTKFALYGMGSVKDERLFRLFRDGKVKFLRPRMETDSWFNVLCVHQNHAAHSKTSYLPEQFIPNFIDFVLWGHEHECIPVPQLNPITNFYTLQAGSSIVTSLSDGEAAPKNVFILKIKANLFNVDPIPLKSVRPFLIGNVSLTAEGFSPGLSSNSDISKFLSLKVDELIEKAMLDYIATHAPLSNDPEAIEHVKSNAPLPLIRLKVDISDNFELENPQRLSKKFVGRVANIDDIFLFHRSPTARKSGMKDLFPGKVKFEENEVDRAESAKLSIDGLIENFVKDVNFSLLSNEGITNAVRSFITKEEKHTINDFIRKETRTHADRLIKMGIGKAQLLHEDIDAKEAFKALLAKLKLDNKRVLNGSDKDEDLRSVGIVSDGDADLNADRSISKPQRLLRAKPKSARSEELVVDSDSDMDDEYVDDHQNEVVVSDDDDDDDEEDDDFKEDVSRKRATSRGSTRGRGSRGRSSTRGRGRTSPTVIQQPSSRSRGKTKPSEEGGHENLLDTLLNISKK